MVEVVLPRQFASGDHEPPSGEAVTTRLYSPIRIEFTLICKLVLIDEPRVEQRSEQHARMSAETRYHIAFISGNPMINRIGRVMAVLQYVDVSWFYS